MKRSIDKFTSLVTPITFALALLVITTHNATAQTNTFPSSGNAGVGTTSPTYKLQVNGNGGTAGDSVLVTDSNTTTTAVDIANTSSGAKKWRLQSVGSTVSGRVGNFELVEVGSDLKALVVQPGGNVGIGTTSPAQTIEVRSTTSGGGALLSNTASAAGAYTPIQFMFDVGPTAEIRANKPNAGTGYGSQINTDLSFRVWDSAISGNWSDALYIKSNGSVGIGTTSPGTLNGVNFGTNVGLHIKGTGTSKYVVLEDSTHVGFVLVDSSQASDNRMWGLLNQNARVSLSTFNDAGTPAEKFTVLRSGNVGIGTSSPTTKLEVSDAITSSGTGAGLIFKPRNGAGQTWQWYNPTGADARLWNTAGGDALTVLNSGTVGIGTSTPNSQYKLDVAGNINSSGTITGNNIVAKYQDVAEWVPSTQQLPSGTVVVLDSTRANEVVASSQAYDTRVAGVISAQPGIALGEGGDGKVLVATTGRVRVRVDATRAPIHIGDLLVTSDVAGVAMKSEAVNLGGVQLHRPGTLIGKALEPLAKGSGEILVLLSLQ